MNKIQCTVLLLAHVMMTSALANPGEFDDMSTLNIVNGPTKSNLQIKSSTAPIVVEQRVDDNAWIYGFGSTSAPILVVNTDFTRDAQHSAYQQSTYAKHTYPKKPYLINKGEITAAVEGKERQHSDEDDGNIFFDGLFSLYSSAENLTVKVTSFVGTHFHSIFCDEEEQQPIANVESQYVYVKPNNDMFFSTNYAIPKATKHQFDFENNKQGLSIFGKRFDVIYELEKHEGAAHPMLNIDQEIGFEIGFSSAM